MKISNDILTLVPYVPGKPIDETKREFNLTEVVKLASNENALGPSPKVLEAIQAAALEIHRYPDPACYDVISALSQLSGHSRASIVCGNGSNELIDLFIRVFAQPGDRVLVSENSFVAYPICAQAAHVQVEWIPSKSDLSFDVEAALKKIASATQNKIRLLFVANPNNPTGQYVSAADFQRILEAAQAHPDLLVVADEAYVEFVRAQDYPDGFALIKKYKNLVVIRTMAKAYGLAGLRFGYAVADPEIIQYIHRVRNPFNVNNIVQAAVIAGLEDLDYMRQSQECVWQGLDYFYKELSRLGLTYIPSQANFVLFDTKRNAEKVSYELLRRGVILRPLKGYNLPQFLRMSVGQAHENQVAIRALEEVLKLIPEQGA